jgi:hypothetical protein
MRILRQSESLKQIFKEQVESKVSEKRENLQESLGGGLLGEIGSGFYDFIQFKNQVKGGIGENFLSFFLQTLPDTWTMLNNGLVPTSSGKLTEIDLLVIGDKGIFLIEVKTWKGSFTCYKDRWKRREGSRWIPLESSPSEQSLYHKTMFAQWINSKINYLPENCIQAPVIFPIAKWIGVTDCSVPVLGSSQELRQFFEDSPKKLAAEQVLTINELLEDLEFPVLTDKSSESKPKPTLRKKTIIN